MRVRGIIHQQICQLRWHFLACLGLVMVLPIEEAVVSFKEGDGFYSSGMIIVSLIFAPLLTGLIACANVQGDFEERRYIFWRSKPVNLTLFITLKFITGLAASLIIIACPVIFGLVLTSISVDYLEEETLQYFLPFPILIAILMYCLCFLCNVLVRRTARAWLIGMLMGAFILVIPFILPLNYKDIVSDVMFGAWGYYTAIMLLASVAAFVFALYAAQHDLHLRTNLKGLLCVVAGLIFVLMMLLNSQVANIKVLHEKEINPNWWGRMDIDSAGDKLIFRGQRYININNNKISFSDINSNPDNIEVPITTKEGYQSRNYLESGELIKVVGDNLYCFSIYADYHTERTEREKPPLYKDVYEKLYLRSLKHTGNRWTPVCELDISDCLKDNPYFQTTMRLIENKLIIIINKSLAIIDVSHPDKLKLINLKLNVLENIYYLNYRQKEFTIPILPLEEIDIKERIRLSIDRFFHYNDIFKTSIVDIHNEEISFFRISHDDIARFNVTDWDDENIYCKFSTSRPFTILEHIIEYFHPSSSFVKDGKLYCPRRQTLMVFDIRSEQKIRKLGHFVRMDYEIEDIAVLENGNILVSMYWLYNISENHTCQSKRYLCLLENPQ